jgi:hypothetical protein
MSLGPWVRPDESPGNLPHGGKIPKPFLTTVAKVAA